MLKTLTAVAIASAALVPGVAAANANQDAQTLVQQSADVLHKMEVQPHVRALLRKAKGVFIVPRFGQGGLVVGARGGEGVLLAHLKGRWSNPAFYNLGGVSIGAQAGGAGGSVAYILMSRNALDDLKGSNNFSLNANAGLSIVNYSAKAQAGWGKADAIVWSDEKGAYGGATIGVTDIAKDKQQNQAFYGDPNATTDRILNGKEKGGNAQSLKSALPT